MAPLFRPTTDSENSSTGQQSRSVTLLNMRRPRPCGTTGRELSTNDSQLVPQNLYRLPAAFFRSQPVLRTSIRFVPSCSKYRPKTQYVVKTVYRSFRLS